MRGMPSFNPIRDNGNAIRGRNKALDRFFRTLKKAFPELTEAEALRLCKWARERARGWSFVNTAHEALERKGAS